MAAAARQLVALVMAPRAAPTLRALAVVMATNPAAATPLPHAATPEDM